VAADKLHGAFVYIRAEDAILFKDVVNSILVQPFSADTHHIWTVNMALSIMSQRCMGTATKLNVKYKSGASGWCYLQQQQQAIEGHGIP